MQVNCQKKNFKSHVPNLADHYIFIQNQTDMFIILKIYNVMCYNYNINVMDIVSQKRNKNLWKIDK